MGGHILSPSINILSPAVICVDVHGRDCRQSSEQNNKLRDDYDDDNNNIMMIIIFIEVC